MGGDGVVDPLSAELGGDLVGDRNLHVNVVLLALVGDEEEVVYIGCVQACHLLVLEVVVVGPGDVEGPDAGVCDDGLDDGVGVGQVLEVVCQGVDDSHRVDPEGDGTEDTGGSLGSDEELVQVETGVVVAHVAVTGVQDLSVGEDDLHVEDVVLGGSVLEGSDSHTVGGEPCSDGRRGEGGGVGTHDESLRHTGVEGGLPGCSGLDLDGHVLLVDDDLVEFGRAVADDSAECGLCSSETPGGVSAGSDCDTVLVGHFHDGGDLSGGAGPDDHIGDVVEGDSRQLGQGCEIVAVEEPLGSGLVDVVLSDGLDQFLVDCVVVGAGEFVAALGDVVHVGLCKESGEVPHELGGSLVVDLLDVSVGKCPSAGLPSAAGLDGGFDVIHAVAADESGVPVDDHGHLGVGFGKVGDGDDCLELVAGRLVDRIGLLSAVGLEDGIGLGRIGVDECLCALVVEEEHGLSVGDLEGEPHGLEVGVADECLDSCVGLCESSGDLVGEGFGDSGRICLEGGGGDDSDCSLGSGEDLVEVVSGHVCADVVVTGLDDGSVLQDDLEVEDGVPGGSVFVASVSGGVGTHPLADGGPGSVERLCSKDESLGCCGVDDGLEGCSGLGLDGVVLGNDLDLLHLLGEGDSDGGVSADGCGHFGFLRDFGYGSDLLGAAYSNGDSSLGCLHVGGTHGCHKGFAGFRGKFAVLFVAIHFNRPPCHPGVTGLCVRVFCIPY